MINNLFKWLLLFFAHNSIGQQLSYCTSCLNDTLVDGTVVNKLDERGRKHGLYVLPAIYSHRKTTKEDFISIEKEGYEIGYYEHGCPVGTWISHSPNWYRREGKFHCNVKSKEIKFREIKGKDFKIGVWTTYRPDSSIAYRRKYEYFLKGKFWTDLIYEEKRNDTTFYLAKTFKYNKTRTIVEEKNFDTNGKLKVVTYKSPTKRQRKVYLDGKLNSYEIAYYENKLRKIYIVKEYDKLGRITKNITKKGEPDRYSGWWGCTDSSEPFF